MMRIDYADYRAVLSTMDNVSNFKSHPKYRDILEHVSQSQGLEYYNLLSFHFDMEAIAKFCILNDTIGNPIKYLIQEKLVASPTSLRYLYHAHQILSHYTGGPIVEVGGGYGGLCLAIDYVAKIRNIAIPKYTIIDLTEASRMQQMYLAKFPIGFPVEFHDSNTHGSNVSGTNNFMISNYCISEIFQEHRDAYYRDLLPKIAHGFIIWNSQHYDFPRLDVLKETEIPLTGTYNIILKF
jgi:hypothetical protein